jgi:hypothetical protein
MFHYTVVKYFKLHGQGYISINEVHVSPRGYVARACIVLLFAYHKLFYIKQKFNGVEL